MIKKKGMELSEDKIKVMVQQKKQRLTAEKGKKEAE